MSRTSFGVAALLLALGIPAAADAGNSGAIGGSGGSGGDALAAAAAFYANSFEKRPSVRAMSEIGREMFIDPGLSASGRISCATCHDPARSYGPPNDLPVQWGGVDGRQAGVRAVPSLMYMQNSPPFTEHFFDDDGDDSVDQGPTGGRTWDGRAESAHAQARLPLLSPLEMANADAAAVTAKLRRAPYAAQFPAVFGDRILDDDESLWRAALMALETFQQDSARFYPYTSKYDAWLRHQATLTPQELRGLEAFNDPAKGNCARCHPSGVKGGGFPQFTDFGYAAIGVPRNAAIGANADARYHDLGLCGPLRTDLADKKPYCGMFRTPTLRNVATRGVFFHNGVFHRLEDVLRFYAQRDTAPEQWYGAAGGSAGADLPQRYQANLDRQAPFGRGVGEPPAFDAADIRDLLAFLATLNDGYGQTQ
jgi:cytochrome c peroxidase